MSYDRGILITSTIRMRSILLIVLVLIWAMFSYSNTFVKGGTLFRYSDISCNNM